MPSRTLRKRRGRIRVRTADTGELMQAILTVLGRGTSTGVPTIGCLCAVCHLADAGDRRTRPSVMLSYGARNVLIDTTPDFREQALREKIIQLDAVLYPHTHAEP